MGKGSISFRDVHDKTAVVTVADVGDPSELQAIRQTINNYSNAVPQSQSYSEAINIGFASTGKTDSVEIKAIMLFRDTVETNPSKAIKELSLSAPRSWEVFEAVEDAGYRVREDVGEEIADIINSACGFSWEFVKGYMDGHRLFKKV